MTRINLRLNPLFIALTLSAAALAAPLAQAADAPAYAITGDATYIGDRAGTTGFVFTAQQSASLNGLGFHDYQLDGLHVSHDVALYSFSGDLLAKATIAAGTSAPLIGQYRYALLDSAFVLQAGTQYVLAAHTDSTDGYRYGSLPSPTLTVNPLISITPGAGVYNYGPSLAFPTAHGWDMYATPNMLLAAAVPEPGSWALTLAGLAVVAGLARRSRG